MVGVGSCGLDYLAQIATWPKPDDKLRTESLEVLLCQRLPEVEGIGLQSVTFRLGA